MKLVILFIFFILKSSSCQNEGLSCSYSIYNYNFYECDLLIQNPNGLNNFAYISGTHLTGKSDSSVSMIKITQKSNSPNLPAIICEKFKNVRSIDISMTGFEKLDQYSLKGCLQLESFIVINNELKVIDERAFELNTNIRKIMILSLSLNEIPERLFQNQLNLIDLSIAWTSISDFPSYTFAGLKNLEYLSLIQNKLTKLKHSWFAPLTKLKSIALSGNDIEELPKYIFSQQLQLENLLFSNNKIKVISSESLEGLYKLNQCNFGDNQIYAIDENFVINSNRSYLIFDNNLCVSESFYKDSAPTVARKCFDNYRILEENSR